LSAVRSLFRSARGPPRAPAVSHGFFAAPIFGAFPSHGFFGFPDFAASAAIFAAFFASDRAGAFHGVFGARGSQRIPGKIGGIPPSVSHGFFGLARAKRRASFILGLRSPGL
jgi:hypothetical protein